MEEQEQQMNGSEYVQFLQKLYIKNAKNEVKDFKNTAIIYVTTCRRQKLMTFLSKRLVQIN